MPEVPIDNATEGCHIVKAVSKPISGRLRARELLHSWGGEQHERKRVSGSFPASASGRSRRASSFTSPRSEVGVDELLCQAFVASESYRVRTEGEEAALSFLAGPALRVGAGGAADRKAQNVFDGFPYALYLPTAREASFRAESVCEIAECRVPSQARLEARLITP